MAAITAGGVTQVALGTSRVWYSEQWFRTFADNAVGMWRVQAVTLPSFTDPRAGNANDAVTDVLEPGPVAAGDGGRLVHRGAGAALGRAGPALRPDARGRAPAGPQPRQPHLAADPDPATRGGRGPGAARPRPSPGR